MFSRHIYFAIRLSLEALLLLISAAIPFDIPPQIALTNFLVLFDYCLILSSVYCSVSTDYSLLSYVHCPLSTKLSPTKLSTKSMDCPP
jgi:hypothetical protein